MTTRSSKWDTCDMRTLCLIMVCAHLLSCSKPEADSASRAARDFASAYWNRRFDEAALLCAGTASAKIAHDARAFESLRTEGLVSENKQDRFFSVSDSTADRFVITITSDKSDGGSGSDRLALDLRQDSVWKIINYQFLADPHDFR